MGIAIPRAYLLNTNDSKVSGYQYLSISPFTYILEYSASLQYRIPEGREILELRES